MTTTTPSNPHVLPATTHSYLARAAESLSEAVTSTEVTTRYACAHVAALRAAAALLAARARPAVPSRRRPQKNAGCCSPVAPGLASGPASPPAPASGPGGGSAGGHRAEADDLSAADRFWP
jgi:hypothetical protein